MAAEKFDPVPLEIDPELSEDLSVPLDGRQVKPKTRLRWALGGLLAGLKPADLLCPFWHCRRFQALATILCTLLGLFTLELGQSLYGVLRGQHHRRCEDAANATWENPGGVSAGLSFCIHKFVELSKAGKDAYALIDPPNVAGVRRQRLQGISVPWKVSFNASDPFISDFFMSHGHMPSSGRIEAGEWLLPRGYRQRLGEARVVFVHGGAAQEDALGRDYAGLTMRLANWTDLPVLAFNYPTEPVVPWPGNIRSVLQYLAHALENGPEGPGSAGSLLIVADSEGTLVTMQTVLMLLDDHMLTLLGFGQALRRPRSWLAGVVLSSPVVDVACETASFAWNCFDEKADTGDPDVGNCSKTPTLESKIADCRWSYLTYFYGFSSAYMAKNASMADAEWEARRDFFELGLVNPLRADLRWLPPLLLLGAARDYYYSDAVALGRSACKAGVDVENFNAVGSFHDFIEYSEGCGGPAPLEEAREAFRRVRAFAQTRTRALRRPGSGVLVA